MTLSCDYKILLIQQMEFLGLTPNGNFSLLARRKILALQVFTGSSLASMPVKVPTT